MAMKAKTDSKFLPINSNWHYMSERILIGCKTENKQSISNESNELKFSVQLFFYVQLKLSVVHDIKGKVNSKFLSIIHFLALSLFILLRNCVHEDNGIDFVCLQSIVVSLVCDFLSNYVCYMSV